jgi:hypothetical protein
MKIWYCKIGEIDAKNLEQWNGADLPMRAAIERAYKDVTGEDAQFCFSGWGGELDEAERAAVEDRLPNA